PPGDGPTRRLTIHRFPCTALAKAHGAHLFISGLADGVGGCGGVHRTLLHRGVGTRTVGSSRRRRASSWSGVSSISVRHGAFGSWAVAIHKRPVHVIRCVSFHCSCRRRRVARACSSSTAVMPPPGGVSWTGSTGRAGQQDPGG